MSGISASYGYIPSQLSQVMRQAMTTSLGHGLNCYYFSWISEIMHMGDRLVILMGGKADIIEAHKWSRLMFRHSHLQTETLLFNTATRWSTAWQRVEPIASPVQVFKAQQTHCQSLCYHINNFINSTASFTKPQWYKNSLVRSSSKAPWCSRFQ